MSEVQEKINKFLEQFSNDNYDSVIVAVSRDGLCDNAVHGKPGSVLAALVKTTVNAIKEASNKDPIVYVSLRKAFVETFEESCADAWKNDQPD